MVELPICARDGEICAAYPTPGVPQLDTTGQELRRDRSTRNLRRLFAGPIPSLDLPPLLRVCTIPTPIGVPLLLGILLPPMTAQCRVPTRIVSTPTDPRLSPLLLVGEVISPSLFTFRRSPLLLEVIGAIGTDHRAPILRRAATRERLGDELELASETDLRAGIKEARFVYPIGLDLLEILGIRGRADMDKLDLLEILIGP